MGKRICSVLDCGRPVDSHAMCGAHMARKSRSGDVQAELPIRLWRYPEGTLCVVDGCLNRVRSRGWCSAHYARWRTTGDINARRPVVSPRYKTGAVCAIDGCERPEWSRGLCQSHYGLQWRYKLTDEDLRILGADAACDVCGEPATDIDHDHKTGKVRGKTCGRCNRSMGQMRDSPELLRAAADYLERHAARRTPLR